MEFSEGLRLLESRTRLAVGAAWGVVFTGGLMALGQLLEAMGLANTLYGEGPLDLLVGLSYVLFLLSLVVSIVVVSMWIYRAHANLRDAGIDGLEFTPGWAVGWYFIPFANLFKPFQAMRELWAASHAESGSFNTEAPPEVRNWWICWIGGNILSNVSSRIGDGTDPTAYAMANVLGAVASAIVVGAAVLLIKLMREITAAQTSGGTSVQVFA